MDLTTSDGSVPAGTVRSDPSGSVSVSVASDGRSIMSQTDGSPSWRTKIFAVNSLSSPYSRWPCSCTRSDSLLALFYSVTYHSATTSATRLTLHVTVSLSGRRV